MYGNNPEERQPSLFHIHPLVSFYNCHLELQITHIFRTLLFAPFVPTIVLFCNIMETQNQSDLDLFGAFLSSIESASAVSEPAAKMHRLFQVLYNIAARYIQLQMQSDAGQTEAQLATLGLPRARTWSTAQLPTQSSENHEGIQTGPLKESDTLGATEDPFQWAVNPMFWTGNVAELENWLYENQSSMEALQDSNTNSTSTI